MKHIKHWLATMVVLLCSVTASAHNFEVGGIYYNITSSTDLTVEVTYKGSSEDEYSNEYSGAVSIPSTITYNRKTYSVTSIGDYAFYHCSSLTSITIPESVTSIGDSAFEDCISLTAITIPESVTSIGDWAFYCCFSLTSITIPEGLTSIGRSAFSGAAWYENQPDGVIYIGKVLNGYKGTMPANTSVEVREGTVSISSYAFSDCISLTSITIPESVTEIGALAFAGCSSLTSITIPESVTSIGDYAFEYCSSLASIIIPESMTSIGSYTFFRCSSLTSITIPESVTSIGYAAFEYCSSLASIIIPESVTSIGDYAFAYCSSLTSIICEAINPPTIGGSDTFYGVNKSIPIYVPESSMSAYKAASYWEEFANIIGVIPEEQTIAINQYGSGTYCSPYALDFSEAEGLKAYAATGYDTETGVVTLTRVMTAKAGMGLFVKGEPGDYVVPTLESTSFNTLNMLVGTSEEVTLGRTSEDGLYVNYKYTLSGDNATPQFYVFDDGFTLSAGKAYLQVPAAWVQTEARSISLRFDDGETTDIEEPELKIESSTVIFDLMGRRVVNPVKGGVYVVNGKKVIY